MYALLDDQSDACSIKETTLEKLDVTGPEVQLKLSTVLAQQTIPSKKVAGLVRGIEEKTDISLPKVYTRELIPTKRSQIPRPDTALKSPHLESIASCLMPYRSNVDVGLLIGINCIRAIKPLTVIPGKDDEPYAVKTALGWGVVGILSPNT